MHGKQTEIEMNNPWCSRSPGPREPEPVIRDSGRRPKPKRWGNVRHPVRHVETGKVYDDVAAASDATGISKQSIYSSCNGNRPRTRGQHFEYEEGDSSPHQEVA